MFATFIILCSFLLYKKTKKLSERDKQYLKVYYNINGEKLNFKTLDDFIVWYINYDDSEYERVSEIFGSLSLKHHHHSAITYHMKRQK